MEVQRREGMMNDQASAPHGQKRRAQDELRNEQRLAKRFDLLNLGQNGKLFLPVQQPPSHRSHRADTNDESMQLDDTKDKVYIHNLDEELSDIESEEERLVFLPDIEKKLGKIPKSVLTSETHPAAGNQMVLYSVPTSLSVPKEQDKVRKAIIESRARAREKQAQDVEVAQVDDGLLVRTQNGLHNTGHVAGNGVLGIEGEEDADAMDLG